MPGNEVLLRRGAAAVVSRDVPGLTLLDAYEAIRRTRAAERPVLFDGGAWSAIALEPRETLRLGEAWEHEDAHGTRRLSTPRALDHVRASLREWTVEDGAPFVGGWAGYFGFEFAAELERLPLRVEADVPRAELRFFTASLGPTAEGVRVSVLERESPRAAEERLDGLVRDLRGPPAEDPRPPLAKPAASSFARPAFEDAVRRVLAYIREGHAYQVNLAQRFRGPLPMDPWSAYRRARARNPSPFMGYVPGDGWAIACNSPERLVTTRGRDAFTSPIAGTRRRGASPGEDDVLEAELRRDAKENAEHVMLVDLERNDLGKACAFGSVRVAPDELMTVERYSHVMHLVSHVRGRLAPGKDALDALLALFPGGTVTGVPKVRACEILAELEPVPRGPYTGTMGYLSANGASDWNLMIRTLVTRGGEGRVSVGAGIVADSDPGREYEETLAKGRHWFEVLGWRPA